MFFTNLSKGRNGVISPVLWWLKNILDFIFLSGHTEGFKFKAGVVLYLNN